MLNNLLNSYLKINDVERVEEIKNMALIFENHLKKLGWENA
jgi:hypothetical protein